MQILETMHAMVLQAAGQSLVWKEMPVPKPGPGQLLIKVHACGVCRTDLHIMDGDLIDPKLPIIPGHEIVGSVAQIGEKSGSFALGDRIGVPWMGYTCEECLFCRTGRENLCDHPKFTGYTIDGGYAEYTVADQRYCFPLPESFSDAAVAPLLCAGLIGYRSYRMAGDNIERLGIYGFGGAAHIIAQIAVYQGKRVFAFTRPGDSRTAGCRFDLCTHRFATARRPARYRQRRHRCLRRYSHEPYPFLPIQYPLGGAGCMLCSKSYAKGWRRIAFHRAQDSYKNRSGEISFEDGKRSAGTLA
jgi:D-arabinose 1-dehydrogenase-like Zn-dependent alcohol dehydrogenase